LPLEKMGSGNSVQVRGFKWIRLSENKMTLKLLPRPDTGWENLDIAGNLIAG